MDECCLRLRCIVLAPGARIMAMRLWSWLLLGIVEAGMVLVCALLILLR
jgi:hypothetical protein